MWSTSASAKVRPSYVSARAYWHLLQANLAWHRSDLSTAAESFRVALIYDPGSRLVRARLHEFLWSTQPRFSENKLRKQQRRLKGDARIYRLLGLEKWSRGEIKAANKYFRRAFSRLNRKHSDFHFVFIRDYALFLQATGRRKLALRIAKKVRDQELRLDLLSTLEDDCSSVSTGDDGEHICRSTIAPDVKPLQQEQRGSFHHWLAPIQNSKDYALATQACLKSPQKCGALRTRLQRLVHPLPVLYKLSAQ